jgi:S-formylglutathione hydrolase FrmB
MYVSCGTEDILYDDNLAFVRAAEAAGVPLTVDLRPGEHEWGFWDAGIQRVLARLPLSHVDDARV